MKNKEFLGKVTKAFSKFGFTLKKHSPEILLASGIVGVVTAAVMACKATTKVGDVMDTAKKNIDIIHETTDNESKELVPQEVRTKALAKVYLQTGLKLVKLYGPSVAVGALSITGILASNNILRKRNMALAAAYLAVDKGFKEYRARVVDRFGETVDHELRYDIKTETIEKTEIDPETGKKKKVKETVKVANPDAPGSVYARYFDQDTTPAWEKDKTYSLMFCKAQQKFANDTLQSKGHIFLNEVYDMLGLERSVAGNVVGWTFVENGKNPNGDNYVDFGIFEVNRPDGNGGYTPSILLDFNVDGDILNTGAISTDI
jgi:hypothetical protein